MGNQDQGDVFDFLRMGVDFSDQDDIENIPTGVELKINTVQALNSFLKSESNQSEDTDTI